MTLLDTTTRTPERQRLSQPVLFLIDDDGGVVHALRDDLSRRFGEDFRVTKEPFGLRFAEAPPGSAAMAMPADDPRNIIITKGGTKPGTATGTVGCTFGGGCGGDVDG